MSETEREPARSALVVFGWLSIAYWLSTAVFPQPIPPLVPLPSFDGILTGVAPWIREQSPTLNRPDEEVVATLTREVLRLVALHWIVVAAGVASGALLIRRSRAGRAIAMALCGGLLLWMFANQARFASAGHLGDRWAALARFAPSVAIADALRVSFLAFTLVFLTRPRVRAAFDSEAGRRTAR